MEKNPVEDKENGMNGKITIQIIEGSSLPICDPSGFSDPFAVVKLGKQKFTTSVIKQNLNPVWNEQFEL